MAGERREKSSAMCLFPLTYAGNRLPRGPPAREPPHPSIGSGGLEPCAERSNRHGILHSWDPGCGVGGASRRRRWARLGWRVEKRRQRERPRGPAVLLRAEASDVYPGRALVLSWRPPCLSLARGSECGCGAHVPIEQYGVEE